MQLDFSYLANALFENLVHDYYRAESRESDYSRKELFGLDRFYNAELYMRHRDDRIEQHKVRLRSSLTRFINALDVRICEIGFLGGTLLDFIITEKIIIKSSRSKGEMMESITYKLHTTIRNLEITSYNTEVIYDNLVVGLLKLWKLVDKACIGHLVVRNIARDAL
jgi:hypothetical protein